MTPPPVRLRLLDTGYCTADHSHVLKGAPHSEIRCHALVALIEHPIHGLVLWDAGYATRLFAALRSWPYRVYHRITPLFLDPQLDLSEQLPALGVRPTDIGTLVISHFHVDHIASLRDFPAAAFVADADALDSIIGLKGVGAMRRGFVPGLLPDDFADRLRPIYRFSGPVVAPFGAAHDLLGDGSLLLVRLPGHARGQLGMLLHTAAGAYLLAADGAWTSQGFREQRGPGRPGYLIADDPRALDATLAKLHAFAAANPTTTIIPTHCPESYALVGRGEL